MAKTQLARTGASQWSADADTWPGRTGWNTELATLDTAAALWGQGTTAARPVSAYPGRFYWATDTSRLWYDNGTAWTEVSPVGGGGTPVANAVGLAGAEGTSRIAARADHQHALLVPGADPAAVAYGGAMSRGSSATVARADHTHALPALTASLPYGSSTAAIVENTAGVAGSSTSVARADHTHTMTPLRWGGTFQGDGSPGIPSDNSLRYIPFQSVGSSVGGAALTGGAINVGYTGVYHGYVKASFEISLPQVNFRLVTLGVNGNGTSFGKYEVPVGNGHSSSLFVPFRIRVAAGTPLTVMCGQNSGSVSFPDVEMGIDLISLG